MFRNLSERLAVCSWSLQPTSAEDLLEKLNQIGIHRVQLAIDPLREQPKAWSRLHEFIKTNKISVVSGMFVTLGEDYSSMESIRRTGGLVPDETWEENWENVPKNAEVAQQLGIHLMTFHAGFIPHDAHDPEYTKLLHRIRLVADVYAAKGIHLAFETGQETARDLNHFLQALGRQTVGVNFDPANMLLYEKGDPIQSLHALGPWLRQCHLKDAIQTTVPGTWGQEVPVGSGQVRWQEFFKVVQELGFQGDLCFEREAGEQRVKDIQAGWQFVTQLLKAGSQ